MSALLKRYTFLEVFLFLFTRLLYDMHTASWSLIPVSTSASVHLSGDVTRNRSRILFSLVGCWTT